MVHGRRATSAHQENQKQEKNTIFHTKIIHKTIQSFFKKSLKRRHKLTQKSCIREELHTTLKMTIFAPSKIILKRLFLIY